MNIAENLLNKHFCLFPNTGEHAEKNQIYFKGEKCKSDFAFFDTKNKFAYNSKKIEVENKPYFLILNVFDSQKKESLNGTLYQNKRDSSPEFTGYLGDKKNPVAKLQANRKQTREGKWYLYVDVLPADSERLISLSECPF
jgi:hypothetical protein